MPAPTTRRSPTCRANDGDARKVPQKLPADFRLPNLKPWGLVFQGARFLIVEGRPATQLFYTTDNKALGPLTVVVGTSPKPDVAPTFDRRDDLNVLYWRHHGHAYALVGTANIGYLWNIYQRHRVAVRRDLRLSAASVARPEGQRQDVAERDLRRAPATVARWIDGIRSGELGDALTAAAAGRRRRVAVAHHRDLGDAARAAGDHRRDAPPPRRIGPRDRTRSRHWRRRRCARPRRGSRRPP